MKKLCLFAFIVILIAMIMGCGKIDKKEPDAIKKVIKDFFEIQYDAYLDFDYKDLTAVLDMNQIQNQNKVVALKNLILQRKYIDEHGYWYVEKNKFPYRIVYGDVVANNNWAMAAIEIELMEPRNAYPPFIAKGRQSFELEKQAGSWKIISHDWEGLTQFEWSTSELIPELTAEQMAQKIEKEYSPD